jgi:protein ImuB
MQHVLKSALPIRAIPMPEGDSPSRNARRYLALWFPFLSTDRVRREAGLPRGGDPDEPPLVLVGKDRGALRVAALDPAAARIGLKLGMSLAEARTLLPAIAAAAADPQADQAFLLTLAAGCEIVTPLVSLRGRDGLILDITGCAHLFGGETGLRDRVCRRLVAGGMSVRGTIAGAPDAAWTFSRFAKVGIVPPGGEEEQARALPVAALDQTAATTLSLARAGFRTLGDLADRPANLLVARFGAGLMDRLNRILGREDIRIIPLRPPPDIGAETHFPEPLLHMESLVAALERLALNIASSLERRGEGGRAFEASFFRADGSVRRITIETAQGTRTPDVLMRLLKLRIGTLSDPLDPGFGFDAIRLGVLRTETLEERQKSLDGGTGEGDAECGIAALVDRLVARFGRENVLRFIARDTHDPVRAGGTVPYLSEHGNTPWPEPEPGNPPARPLTLFIHPQPIDVLAEVPDSPPLRFRWRRVLHEVARAEGPERIAPEWWLEGNSAPATRDYYRIEDAMGHRFWVFREGLYEDSNARPRWFLHGLFA